MFYWSKGWWRWWWQLDYWSSYKSCKAPVKSSPPTNQHPGFFTGQMPFLSPNQQCQSTEGKKITHSMDLLTPSSNGVFQLCRWPLRQNFTADNYLALTVSHQRSKPVVSTQCMSHCHCLQGWSQTYRERERERERQLVISRLVTCVSNTTDNILLASQVSRATAASYARLNWT